MSNAIRKILYAFFTIFTAISTIFFIIRFSPGDPLELVLGPKATGMEILKLKKQLGMDLPILIQYKNYLFGLLKGDLGKSIISSKEVKGLMLERFQATFIIAFFSIGISAFIGVIAGIYAGFKKSNHFDLVTRIISLIALSFPIFSLAPILVIVFSIKFKIFPVSEWGSLKHAFLPVLTLVIPLSSVIMRVTRNKFLEEENYPWVMVLYAKGLSDTQVLIRILKVCLPTILNIISIQLSVVIAGTMITETIFDIPGMGSLLFDGISARDYPVVQGVIIYSTFMYMIIYFFIDYINEKIDPRIIGSSVEE